MNGAFSVSQLSVSVLLPVSPIQTSLPTEEFQQSHNGHIRSTMMALLKKCGTNCENKSQICPK